MSFLTRQNKLPSQDQSSHRTHARAPPNNQIDPSAKLTQQQLYKQQLQRQIMEKQQRKKKQLQKIRKQDQKFMREVQELNRMQKQQKQRQKAKQQRAYENINTQNSNNISPHSKPQINNKQNNKTSRVIGTLNIGIKQQKQREQQSQRQYQKEYQRQQQSLQLPKLGFDKTRQQYSDSPPSYNNERKKQYYYDDYQPANQYYEERIRRHKEQMNQKLDQLFNHIHSTKDNIKADQEIEKIKRRLRSKPQTYGYQPNSDSQVQLDYQNKFYHVPKKPANDYTRSPTKSRALDYQSTSKFTKYNVAAQSRAKTKTQYEDLYSLPETGENQNNYEQKWGSRPDQGKFLGNREALDFQIAKTLGDIDQFQTYLKQKSQ